MTRAAFATASYDTIDFATRPTGRAANDNDDLIIDLFAGGGGASEAILKVTGRHPDIAVNHDAEAISMHEVNHPETLHLCEDIRQVDIPAALAKFNNRRVGLMWASPDCKDHSKAKGGKPKDNNIRGLAWQVVRWASAVRRTTGYLPTVIALENVEEFQDWGPLHRGGRLANTVKKNRRGQTFRLWVRTLRSMGFKVEWRELVAADYGAPTTRKRLFLIARSDGLPIRWPVPSHMKREKILALQQSYDAAMVKYEADLAAWEKAQLDLFSDAGPRPERPTPPATLKVWRSAAEIIQWNLDVPSIFGRKNPLKPKTQARIAKGIQRYVINAAKPFLVNVTHTTRPTGYVYSTDDPARTFTTAKGGEFALAAPCLMPMTHGDGRTWSMTEALRTVTAAPRGEFGMIAPILSTVAFGDDRERAGLRAWSVEDTPRTLTASTGPTLVTAVLVPRYGERPGQEPRVLDIRGPYPTAVPTGNGGDVAEIVLKPLALGQGFPIPSFGPLVYTAPADALFSGFIAQNNGDRIGRGLDDSLTTLTHRGTQQTVAGVFMSKMSENGVGYVPDGPLHTAMAGAPRHYLGVAYLDRNFGSAVSGRSIEEPHPAVMTEGGGGKSSLVTAHLDRMAKGAAGQDGSQPLGAATTRAKDAVIAPFLAKYYRTGIARSVIPPIDSVTTQDRFSLIAPYIEQANTGMVGRAATSPLSTIVGGGDANWGTTQRLVEARLAEMGATTGSRREAVLNFLWEHFGKPTAEQWEDPLASEESRLRFGLVIIDGVVWQIVDIGMRMLVPRELYAAQGFADDYIIDRTSTGKPITKTAQTRMAGNSVSPPPATALLDCNVPEGMNALRMAA